MMRLPVFVVALLLACPAALCLGAERAATPLDEATAKLDAWGTPPAERKTARNTIRDAGARALPHIRALSKSRVWLARSDALGLAAGIKARDLASLIAAGLEDKNWAVRARAAAVAADLPAAGRAKVKPALQGVLKDRIVRVRLAAYATLAKWEPDSKVVWNALDDPDPDVAYWAARNCVESDQLDKVPPAAKVRLTESIIRTFRERNWRDIDEKGVATVFSLGQDARDALYEAIAGEETTVRRVIVSKLGSTAGAKAVDLMFRFVKDPDRTVRRSAVTAVSNHCGVKYAPKLLRLARSSPDSTVAHQVLGALGRLKYRPAIPYLLETAGRREESRRASAFRALALMGDKTLGPKLIELYKREVRSWQRRQMIAPIARLLREDGAAFLKEAAADEEQSIRSQALYAARTYLKEKDRTIILLGLIKTEENDRIRQQAISSLSKVQAGKSIPLLIDAMKTGGPQSRRAAAQRLGQSKSAVAVKAVIDAFATEQEPNVRMAMLASLAQARARQAVPVLKKALSGDDPQMKAAALKALSTFDGALDDDFLVQLVRTEDDPGVLETCVRLIGRRNIRTPQLLPRFAKLMDSDSPSLRRGILGCVSRIDDAGATKILCTAIKKDGESANRAAALKFLVARLTGRKLPSKSLIGPLGEALETDDAAARQTILSALAGRADRRFAPMLLRVLKRDTEAGVRLAAANVIKQVADRQMAPQLIEVAKAEEHTGTLIVLIGALGDANDPSTLPFFRNALQSPEASVQAAALRAIGRFRNASLIPFYIERYKRSTSIDVRLTSLRNIQGTCDRRTIETIRSALKDDDPRIRRAALDAATDFIDADLAAALAERLSGKDVGPGAARLIADALGKIRSRAVAGRLLAAAAKPRDTRSRLRMVTALGKAGDRRAIPLLAAAVKEDASRDLSLAAIQGLAELGATEHAGLCLDAARRSTGSFSRAAASAAARLGGKQSFAYLAERFDRAGEHEKRFYAPLLAQADPAKADDVLRSALADAQDEALIGVLCASLTATSDENIAVVRDVALGDAGPAASLGAVRFLGKRSGSWRTLSEMTGARRPGAVRAAALIELTRLCATMQFATREPPSLGVAIRALASGEPELRGAAVESLQMHRRLADATRLIPLAKEGENERVRSSAILALGSMKDDKDAERVLMGLLDQEKSGALLADVVRSLGLLRSQAAAATLMKLADAGEVSVRVASVEALGRIGTPEALKAVEKAFEQKLVDRVRAAAAQALGGVGNAAYVPRLAEALKGAPGLDVRAACAEALGRLGGDAARAALIEALNQDSALVREAALRALVSIKGARLDDLLKRVLKDDDMRVAKAAEAALQAPEKK